MRREERKFVAPATVALMIALTAAFIVQQFIAPGTLFYYLALSPEGLKHGYVWQLLTFQFLHDGLLHLIFNLIGLWFFGRLVEERLGSRQLLGLYFLSGFAGGLLQALVGLVFPERFGLVVGASAGICGLLAAAALLEPDATILFFFLIPVRARYALILLAVLSLVFTFLPFDTRIAHAAHLGGLLAGVVYVRRGRLLARWQWRPFQPRLRPRELVRTVPKRRALWQRSDRDPMRDLPPGEFISRDVDPILDKISAHGIQSLTPRERQILESAREKMEKR